MLISIVASSGNGMAAQLIAGSTIASQRVGPATAGVGSIEQGATLSLSDPCMKIESGFSQDLDNPPASLLNYFRGEFLDG